MALRALQGPTGGGAPVGGTGITNTIPRWTGPSTLGDSVLVQSGTNAVGFGTPKTWGTNFTLNAIQLSESASLSADINTTYLAANQYWDSPGFQNRRIKANFAARYLLNGASGDHQFQIAPFGAADSGITWSTAMTILNTSGNVGIGTPSPWSKISAVTANGADTVSVGFSFDSANNYRSGISTNWSSVSASQNLMGFLVSNATPTGFTRVMTLNGAGQAAIGTTSFTGGRALTTVADLDVFGVRVGRGGGDGATNVAVGPGALETVATRSWTVAIGANAGANIGAASGNTLIGNDAGRYFSGGGLATTNSTGICIGDSASFGANGTTNEIVIGRAATGNGSNTTTIGTSATTRTVIPAGTLDLSTAATQGLKLPATPGNADTQTLDCYEENTWTPTRAGFGGTNPTVTASYTRVGRLVTITVRIVATGGAQYSGTSPTTTLSMPATITPAANTTASSIMVYGDTTTVGTVTAWNDGLIYLPTFALTTQQTTFSITYRV